jgi:hypothetical protein
MNTVIVRPKTNEQWEALKAVMKVLKIQFEELTTSKKETKDWWNELSEQDKSEIELSLKESEEGKTLTHNQVNARIETLLNTKR